MSEFKLNTIQQFAALSPEQFARMLPDFLAWHYLCHEAQKLGATAVGFTWVDDGNSGQIHSVDIFEPDTGNTCTFDGPVGAAMKGGAG